MQQYIHSAQCRPLGDAPALTIEKTILTRSAALLKWYLAVCSMMNIS